MRRYARGGEGKGEMGDGERSEAEKSWIGQD